MRYLFVYLSLFPLFGQILSAQGILLETFATGLNDPIAITHVGDERLFVVERSGYIRIVTNTGTVLSTPFLNIDSRVHQTGGQSEQGLLGLAFHPNYTSNGYFYVHYSQNNDDSRIARFQVSSGDPNIADPDSELEIITIDQPFVNHNGGDLAFGPDGYLYIGMGDGGAAGDPGNRAQDRLNLLGKMLRIDVDGGNPYAIPANNPYVNDDFTLDEIWALGLRNPWRFSFDSETGDLWIGDVGQGEWEEIDYIAAGSSGGANFGWRCYEGNDAFNTSAGCGTVGDYVAPLHAYAHDNFTHCSITGGRVYRGSRFPDLQGNYFYADFCSGTTWMLSPDGSGGWTDSEVGYFPSLGIAGFGEDVNGEIYVASLNQDAIYRMDVSACFLFDITVTTTDEICTGDLNGAISIEVSTSATSYEVNWSTGAMGDQLMGLGAGVYVASVTDSDGCEIVREIWLTNSSPDNVGIMADGATTICQGESVNLLANEAPAGYSYEWYKDSEIIMGSSEQQLVVDATGWYYVKYIDGPCPPSNTSNWVRVVVNSLPPNPFVEADGETTFCEGDSVRLYATAVAPDGYTHRWMSGIDTIAISLDSSIYVSASGAYFIIYDGLCPSAPSNWITISVDPSPDKPNLNPSDNAVLCDGESQVLTAQSAPATYGYQWYFNSQLLNGATAQSLTVSEIGNYEVLYTGECPSPLSDPVSVSAGISPALFLESPDTLCSGDTLDLTLLTPDDGNNVLMDYDFYRDLPFEANNLLASAEVFMTSTNIYLLGYAADGCQDTLLLPISVYPELLRPEITQDEATLSVPADYTSYQWYLDGMAIAGATDSSYIATENGDYSVEVGDEKACFIRSLSLNVIITNIQETSQGHPYLSVWPNPFSTDILLQFADRSDTDRLVQFWNVNGQLVWEEWIPAFSESLVRIRPNGLLTGLYLLRVQSEEGENLAALRVHYAD